MSDWIGWLATSVFAISYSCKDPRNLRRVQALAAVLWIAYGLLLHAFPVVVANLVIAVLAVFSAWRRPPAPESDGVRITAEEYERS